MKISMVWLIAVAVMGGLAGCAGPVAIKNSTSLDRAIALLQTHATDNDPRVRAECLEGLQPLKDQRLDEAVDRGLRDGNWGVRFAAAMVAGRRQSPALKPVLQQIAVKDTSDSVRAAAIYALYRLGDTSKMNLLPPMLDSPDADTRRNAAFVLGRIGDESALPMLQDHMHEDDRDVKLALIEARAQLGDRSGINTLIATCLSRDALDHTDAMRACAELGTPETINALRINLKLQDPYVPNQLIAARGLGRAGDTGGEKVAREHLRDSDPAIRSLAVLALGNIVPLSEEPEIAKMMDDSNVEVQIAAAAAEIDLFAHAASNQTQPQ